MALYGEQMGDYLAPDGRRITLPQQLAASFPGLQPAPALGPPPGMPQPSPEVAAPLPAFTPQDQPAPPAAPDASAAPVTSPNQVPGGAPVAPQRGPVTAPQAGPDVQGANTPGPVTEKQLATMGVSGAGNAEMAAQDATKEAVRRQGEALANQATAAGAAMAKADAHAAQLLEQRRQAAEQHAQALQAETDKYMRNAKAIADTKIDHSANHPVLAALSAALVGIGQAMAGQKVDAMAPVYQAIDRKVDAQMKDLDQKRQGLAVQREGLGLMRQSGMDRLNEMDTYRLGYLEQAKRQIETIKQQTQSDVVRANSDVGLAAIDQEKAKTLGVMVDRFQTHEEHKAAQKQALQIAQMSNATVIRGQNMQQREADLNREERKQAKLDEIAKDITLAKGKAGEAQAKLVREAGLSDPKTGDPILTEEGQGKMADADKAEAQARAAKDPAQAQKLNEYAATLRQSARLNDVATARDGKDRIDVQHVLNASTDFTDLATRTIRQLEGGPSAFNRETWAALKADLETLKARYVATLGERVSVKALEAFQGVTSIDPDSMFSRGVDKGKAIAALKALNQDTAAYANSSLKGAGIKAKWRPGLSEETTSFAGSTSQEAGQDAKPGLLSSAASALKDTAGAITHPIDAMSEDSPYFKGNPETEAENAALNRTNAKGKVNSYGLDPKVNETVRSLIAESGSVGHKRYEDIVKMLADPLTTDRPGMTYGVARQLRDSDPKLYADVISQLGPERAQEIEANLATSAAAPPTGGYRQRTAADLSDEERAQLEAQRRERTTEEERKKYRDAYDKRAAKGARGQ